MPAHCKLCRLPLDLLRHLLLASGAIIMLAPFVLMVSLSLKPPAEIFAAELRLLPQTWHAVENYSAAFSKQPLARYILNGFLVTGAIFAAHMLAAVPFACDLARVR